MKELTADQLWNVEDTLHETAPGTHGRKTAHPRLLQVCDALREARAENARLKAALDRVEHVVQEWDDVAQPSLIGSLRRAMK